MAHSILASKEELEAIIQRQRRKILELGSNTGDTPPLTPMDVEESYGIGYKDGSMVFKQLLKEAFEAGWIRGANEVGSTAGQLGFCQNPSWKEWIKEKNI